MTTKLLLGICALIFVCYGCEKDKPEEDEIATAKIDETFNFLHTDVRNWSKGWDTTNNYITGYHFSRVQQITLGNSLVGDTSIEGYSGSQSDVTGDYRIRYIGGEDLVDPSTVLKARGTQHIFPIKPALLGKPLFEAYSVKTGKLVKRFICSPDSAAVDIWFSVWDNFGITPQQTGFSLNYCIGVKQSDRITYW